MLQQNSSKHLQITVAQILARMQNYNTGCFKKFDM